MISFLFPWFITAVCIGGNGDIKPPQLFGPFDTIDDAHIVTSFLAYGLFCEPHAPERRWRWTTAMPINIPNEARP